MLRCNKSKAAAKFPDQLSGKRHFNLSHCAIESHLAGLLPTARVRGAALPRMRAGLGQPPSSLDGDERCALLCDEGARHYSAAGGSPRRRCRHFAAHCRSHRLRGDCIVRRRHGRTVYPKCLIGRNGLEAGCRLLVSEDADFTRGLITECTGTLGDRLDWMWIRTLALARAREVSDVGHLVRRRANLTLRRDSR